MTTVNIKDCSSWDQAWQQTHKQHGDQAISMWDSRAHSVLDIGSGPGAFAVPFALRSAQVTAVEPSSSMIELLHQHAHSHGVAINAIEALWEDIHVDHEGWNQAFDLVFASMIPAISSWKYLEKALKCA